MRRMRRMRRMILRISCASCLTYIHRHFRPFSGKVCAESKTVVLPTLIGGGVINAQNAQVFFYIFLGKIKYFNAASLSFIFYFSCAIRKKTCAFCAFTSKPLWLQGKKCAECAQNAPDAQNHLFESVITRIASCSVMPNASLILRLDRVSAKSRP